ncbi:tannase/feruloyl esterase family alpha/beta hydrolase [Kordiimonas pumila]|uniref:Tannase/feruloyl esterase family alpha/beta hydrolase n=1 Tax=Kordiimonas pumila TaxID=2161677 RepID=A0ABV7D457_9PROT|nr:tannase/feruloyl esterase family alpha/beta hydrolase [Kordiimonas pumila]
MAFKQKKTIVGVVAVAAILTVFGFYGGFFSGVDVPVPPKQTIEVSGVPAKTISPAACASLNQRFLAEGQAVVTRAEITEAKGLKPAYCFAGVSFTDSELKFEARLPLEGWNKRLVMVGGGGFDGLLIDTPDFVSPSIMTDRYVAVMTNGGHTSPLPTSYFDADFALNAQQLVDFTYLSEHRALPVVKELVAAVYGQRPERNYFEGCSMGGHDALMESQRFPYDFDGIIARAPAGNVMGLFVKFHQIAEAVDKAGALSDAQQMLLENAVLKSCDMADGLKDGIVSNSNACAFDITTLQCDTASADRETCLSEQQIALVSAITSPYTSHVTGIEHSGFSITGAANKEAWGEYIWPKLVQGGNSLQGLFSGGFIRSFITRDPDYKLESWHADDWKASLGHIESLFQAANPDISKFTQNGGKLLLWHGVADSSVSATDTIGYYQNVIDTIGQQEADKSVELFLAPGVGHCRHGSGPDKVDLLSAMANWVEKGVAPSQQLVVTAKKDDAGNDLLTRPLCKYPLYPEYDGTGDPNLASSFSCSE